MNQKTICQLFEDSVHKYPNNELLLEKKQGAFKASSYSEIREQVYQFAAGLMEIGIKKGDRLALLAEGCNNWVISELGILYAGAINVPLSVKLTDPDELKFRLNHSGSRILIVSQNQNKKLGALKDEIDCIEQVIVFGEPEVKHNKDIRFDEILAKGKAYLESNREKFETFWKELKDDDYANICYTSGTTADPKGIILTHRNYTANVEQARSLMEVPEWYKTLLILPWDHAFAHTCGIYTLLSAGGSMASIELGATPMETLKNIPINIKEIKPSFWSLCNTGYSIPSDQCSSPLDICLAVLMIW